MTYISMLLAAALAAHSSPGTNIQTASATVSSCPAAPERAVNATHDIIKGRGLAALKRQKLNDLKVKDVVPLTDETICARLNKFYAKSTYDKDGWHRAYFSTGGYYLASVYFVPKPGHHTRRGHVAVFSGKLRLVGTADNMR